MMARAKKVAVLRQALAELGPDADPHRIRDLIKERFGLTLRLVVISAYKSRLRQKGADLTRPKAAAADNGARLTGIAVDDIVAVQRLTRRLGAERLHALVDLLAR